MLATDVEESKTGLVHGDGYVHDRCLDGLRRRLSLAEKFLLDPQACAMAASVALSKPSSILAAIAFTKLPFDPMWIEFANSDTRKAMADLGSPNMATADGIVTIERSGFLLSYDGDDVVVEYAHTDRTQDGRRLTDIAPVRARFSSRGLDDREMSFLAEFQKGTETPKLAAGKVQQQIGLVHSNPDEAAADMEIRARFRASPHPDVAPVRRNLVRQAGEAKVSGMELAQGQEMYRLFALQVLPALILLNCRNAVDAEKVPAPERLNRQREKKGRAPVPEHRLVKVHLSPTRRRIYETSGYSAAAARGGIVIGHFKVRKSGIYWWSPHWRGSTSDEAARRTFVLTR